MRDRWHVIEEPGRYVMARRVPVRFDVAAVTRLPAMRKARLALQIRQDMWRALQKLRGFSPVVEIVDEDGALRVTAGGAIDVKPVPRAQIEARLAALLDDPKLRARWTGWAAAWLMALTLAAPVTAAPVPVDVPSGAEVALYGVLLDETPGALWARFRFVAPGLGGALSAEDAAGDMDFLCAKIAVPYLAHNDIDPGRVVISIADREVEFGKKTPEAVQFFEAYTLKNDRCIWEAF